MADTIKVNGSDLQIRINKIAALRERVKPTTTIAQKYLFSNSSGGGIEHLRSVPPILPKISGDIYEILAFVEKQLEEFKMRIEKNDQDHAASYGPAPKAPKSGV